MARCSFCEELIPQGTGKMYVKTEGKILYFCRNKCEKNMIKLGRRPIRMKWTRTYRKAQGSTSKAPKEKKE